MSDSELLDQTDENGNVIGQATRAEFHSNPDMIHRTVHCWIFNDKGEVLMQQRSLKKKLGAGMWDISAGGHVPSEMKPLDAMKMEISEELGLNDIQPTFVDKYLQRFETQTELIYLYYAKSNNELPKFKFDPDEVERLMWIDQEEALNKAESGELKTTDWIFRQLPMIEESMRHKP